MSKYTMTIESNVITHLGINLYSNTPSVLSEIVANAWDADATEVRISITKDEIIIEDDGCGMSVEDMNKCYLAIGHKRRESNAVTPIYKRKVMGRKGIGKLSAFSIAREVKVISQKNSELNGFKMDIVDITKHLEEDGGILEYFPPELPSNDLTLDLLSEDGTGSKIILMNFKKRVDRTADALRRNLARRFGVLGKIHNFEVKINGEEITLDDRGYFDKIQFLWTYGDMKHIEGHCKNISEPGHIFARGNEICVVNDETEKEERYAIRGWIGASSTSTFLKDQEANGIVIMVREKLAQENILNEFAEGGIYATYLVGEIYADYLDLDEKEDITTSSRQHIISNDYRYTGLKKWLHGELKHIESNWTRLRNNEGHKKATKNPAVERWYNSLPLEYKGKAKDLFGNLNRIGIEDDESRKMILKHGILAFESLRYKKNLDALDQLVDMTPEQLSSIFTDSDDLEAALYHRIVTQRLEVINALRDKVKMSEKEKVLQEHLYSHLWLLDPSWERGSVPVHMEESIKELFKEIDKKMPQDLMEGRLDLRYQKTTGQHVIIELKRGKLKGQDYSVSQGAIVDQMSKYRKGLETYLNKINQPAPIQCICVMGKLPSNWDPLNHEEERRSLETQRIHVVVYDELILNAQMMYSEFLDAHGEASNTLKILKELDDLEF
jgi:Molecular chaperone, HSP90 family